MSSAKYRLALLRHSESEWNSLNLFTGWTDVDLTKNGETEAVLAAQILQEHHFNFDLSFTSYLKRAINTLSIIQQQMNLFTLPVTKTWRLNERHYGRLQGMNKFEAATVYGGSQVQKWRRAYSVRPPFLDPNDLQNPAFSPLYRDIDRSFLPLGESLEDTYHRVIPYFKEFIAPEIKNGRQIIIVSHGNTLRTLMKYFENLSAIQTGELFIPTGIPFIYEFDENFNFLNRQFLGDDQTIAQKFEQVRSYNEKLAAISP